MKFKYIIFDVDGTLIDPLEGILKALTKLTKEENLELLDFRNAGVIGPPMKRTLMRLYSFNESDASRYADKFRSIYINETLFFSTLYDGVQELFKKLYENNVKIGIATYKRTDCAIKVIEHYGLKEYTDVICGDTTSSTKTKADIINDCLNAWGIDNSSSILMVGDTNEDFIGANQAGIDFCAVTYGYGFKKDFPIGYEINHIIDNPIELLNILEEKL